MDLSMNTLDTLTMQLYMLAATYAPRLLLALVTLTVGWWLCGRLISLMKRGLDRRAVDPSLKPFLGSLVSVVLKVALIVAVAGMVGIQTTSFVAVLGAAGLAVGLALQGSLANFAGGVLILLFRPFRVGDFIEAQGYQGSVSEIQILFTILNTPDNKRIILPNGPLASGSVTNFSAEDLRRVDIDFGIGYGDDIKKAKEILLKLAAEDERILNEPAEPFVAVGELAESSVNLKTRNWVKAENYWPVYFDLMEKAKTAFDENGISIPFPQRDLHIVTNLESKKVANL